MATANTSLPPVPGTDWHRLGELELPAGASADSAIRNWIAPVLNTLNLSPEFLGRVVKSAQESAMRYLHPDAGVTPGHFHLSIYAPREHLAKGKTWGFFHIERIENRGEALDGHGHAIDYYLYMEGE
jgi:hypothetical protein